MMPKPQAPSLSGIAGPKPRKGSKGHDSKVIPPINETWQYMAIENPPFIADVPIQTSIYLGFPS